MHPWHRLRDLTHVRLVWHDGGNMGETNHNEQKISIRRGMTYEERRSTVLHECLHVERGDVPAGLLAKEEHQVSKESARLLLPSIRMVGDELAWARCYEEAAYELAVDLGTLLTRLKHLHPAEKAWLTRRLTEEL